MEKQKEFVKEIADINADFPQWYTDIVIKTQLADYGPARGTMVIRPYGYAIWENIQKELDRRLKETGHQNAYFPLLIPQSLLQKEAEHVEGFAPEVATVTRAGKEELTEPLVVRPTSEAIICTMFAQWVQSYRDLPLKLNQWANVVRWEKASRPFLRTREFLWQEGHTVHATAEEAQKETLDMLELYSDFFQTFLATPVLTGQKSAKEKFAGAEATYGVETVTLDGKSLQSGTTHYFADKFAKAYDIKYLDRDGKLKYVFGSSWGVSTRMIGALIMAHGDQRGLVLPPAVAPVQVIVIPVAAHKGGVNEAAQALIASLKAAGIRAEGDFSDNSAGWKFNEWEMKGVPLRIEIGPRDIEQGVAACARRDNLEKCTVKLGEGITAQIQTLLNSIQADMLKKAQNNVQSKIADVSNLDEMLEALNGGKLTRGAWCGDAACEEKIKEKTSATLRVCRGEAEGQKCVCCGRAAKANKIYIIARAY